MFLCPASSAGISACVRDTGPDSYWPLTALGALRTVFVVQFGEIASVAEAKVLMAAGWDHSAHWTIWAVLLEVGTAVEAHNGDTPRQIGYLWT